MRHTSVRGIPQLDLELLPQAVHGHRQQPGLQPVPSGPGRDGARRRLVHRPVAECGCHLDDYDTFQIPTGTGRLYGFGEFNYISTKSEAPDAAAKFLDYLESDEVQQKHLGRFGLSVNKHVTYDNPNALTTRVQEIFGSADGLYVNGDQAFPLAQTTEYWRIINEVASDNLDPAEAAGQMQAFIAAN